MFFSDILFSSTSSSSAEGSADVVSSNDLVAQIEVCLAPQVCAASHVAKVSSKKVKVAPFVQQLWNFINEEAKIGDIPAVSWHVCKEGQGIFIVSPQVFLRAYNSYRIKHMSKKISLKTFIRQLHFYRFKKISGKRYQTGSTIMNILPRQEQVLARFVVLLMLQKLM